MTRDDDTVGQADAESFELPEAVDALLCFYTNDILISPTALPRAFGVLRPGARIVVAGVKLREPYAHLRQRLADFVVEEHGLGSQYVAWGIHRP